MKIAPTLQRYCSWSPRRVGQTYRSAAEIRKAQADLRALLAVARKARDFQEWFAGVDWLVPNTRENDLFRALARLERASRNGR
jgi:hypothetical protein